MNFSIDYFLSSIEASYNRTYFCKMVRYLFRNFIEVLLLQIIRIQRFLFPPEKSGKTYQISRIYCRFKTPVAYVKEENFLCGNPKTESMEAILESKFVAIEYKPEFTVLLESEKDIYNVQKYPFFYNAIFQESRQKILVQTAQFLELIDSQPWPEVHLIFLWSTGRCGSTLLANLFTSFDKFCTISEPDDIFITFANKQKMTSKFYEKCLVNSLKFHLVQVKKVKPETKYVVVKTRNTWFWYITKTPVEIQDKVTHIFMYRDVLPTVKSFQRVFEKVKPTMNSLEKLIEQAVESLEKTLEDIFELKPAVDLVKQLRNGSSDTMVRTTFAGVPYLLLLYHHLIKTAYYPELAKIILRIMKSVDVMFLTKFHQEKLSEQVFKKYRFWSFHTIFPIN